MKTIAFFNNKGGVGKTSLVYHLSWMLKELGVRVIAIDLDPQSNLTSAFLSEEELEALWPEGPHPETILGGVDRLIQKLGDFTPVAPRQVADGLGLVAGDLGLGAFEDRLSQAWRDCLSDAPDAADAFRVMTAFYRIALDSGSQCRAQMALMDVGPSIGAMNRGALVASDLVVIPLGADLFSLQGLRNLGPTLRDWRKGWKKRRDDHDKIPKDLILPQGEMTPIGYVLLNPSVRTNRPVKAYKRWGDRIPEVYRHEVLDGHGEPSEDNQLAMIKHFKSLMPLAQDARKPMFLLKPADGAIGSHAGAVAECYDQFKKMAERILAACGLTPTISRA